MKISIVLAITATLGIYAAPSYSQNTKLTLKLKNVSITQLLNEIGKQSEFSFWYSIDELSQKTKLTLAIKDQTIDQILDIALRDQNLAYEIKDRVIIIYRPAKEGDINNITSPQQQTLTGTVTDATNGEPVAGANIIIEGTTLGVVTDANGKFSIEVPKADAVLVVSFIGYNTENITLAGQSTLDIKLIPDITALQDVVVVGYGTMKKATVTSAVASVKADDFVKGSVTDAAQLIKGKVAGITVVNPDANPTRSSQILMRGVVSLYSAGAQPLVVIDGIPGALNDVAPDDIESFDILKDGSAAAIYGTRGNNGVILITTKKVKGNTPATLEYNGYVTTQAIARELDVMNAAEYRQLVAKGIQGTIDHGSETNWFDQIFQSPVSHTHNLSFKGGSANTNYIMNVNYKNLEGLILTSKNNVLNMRIEANHSMFDGKLKLNGSIMGYKQESPALLTDDGSSEMQNRAYYSAIIYNPTSSIKDENGNWTEFPGINEYFNPLALLKETEAVTKRTYIKPFGTITILPVKDLTLKVLGSTSLFSSMQGYFETSKNIRSTKFRSGYNLAQRTSARTAENLLEVTANYTKSLGKHSFNVLGGYSYQDYMYEYFQATNTGLSDDYYTYNSLNLGKYDLSKGMEMSSKKNSNRLVGFFTRGNYNFADKYMLMVSVRYDGSSKFGDDNKWGVFPSVSAGWNLMNESFMENLKSTFSALKLRGGFGITGTIPNDAYASLARFTFGDYGYIDGEYRRGITPTDKNPNPDLRWERKEETNFGLDFGLLNNRISGSIDLYQRTTKDLIWEYPVAKPPYLLDKILANAGSIENKGVEIIINATPVQTAAITWNTSVNFSTNKNKVISLSNDKFLLGKDYFYQGNLGEPLSINISKIQEGQPVGNFYSYKSIDIDENGYWIIEGKDGQPKSIHDAVPDDKQVTGNGLPKQYLAWNNTLIWENLDLNISIRGAFGFQILNEAKLFHATPWHLSRGNVLTSMTDKIYGKRALADGTETGQAQYGPAFPTYVSYYIEDGDYWKIDNITLGYTLNFKQGAIKTLRVYASGSNLVTFTKYSGLDPEVNSTGLYPGFDSRYRYPSTRSYTLGLSVKF